MTARKSKRPALDVAQATDQYITSCVKHICAFDKSMQCDYGGRGIYPYTRYEKYNPLIDEKLVRMQGKVR